MNWVRFAQIPGKRCARLLRRARNSKTCVAASSRLDTKAQGGPWTPQVLELLRDQPQVRAADLCGRVHQEKDEFKG